MQHPSIASWFSAWQVSDGSTFPNSQQVKNLDIDARKRIVTDYHTLYTQRHQIAALSADGTYNGTGKPPRAGDEESFLKRLIPELLELRPLTQQMDEQVIRKLHELEAVHPVQSSSGVHDDVDTFRTTRLPPYASNNAPLYDKQAFGLFLPWEDDKPSAVLYINLKHAPGLSTTAITPQGSIPTRILPGNISVIAQSDVAEIPSQTPEDTAMHGLTPPPNTGVAYSVCNLLFSDADWQPELQGIPVGRTIIEKTFEALSPAQEEREAAFQYLPELERFVTLSPLRQRGGTHFMGWLEDQADDNQPLLTQDELTQMHQIAAYLYDNALTDEDSPFVSQHNRLITQKNALELLSFLLKERVLHPEWEEGAAFIQDTDATSSASAQQLRQQAGMRHFINTLTGDLALDYLVRGNSDAVENFHLRSLGGYIGGIRVLGRHALLRDADDISDWVMVNYVHNEPGMEERAEQYRAFRKTDGAQGCVAMAEHLQQRYESRQGTLIAEHQGQQTTGITLQSMDGNIKGLAHEPVKVKVLASV